jgi:large subunit ribosomal protein L37e
MKGTYSMGRKSGKKSHIRCRRCGKRSYHIKKKRCSSCGYGKSAKIRKYAWQKKRYNK